MYLYPRDPRYNKLVTSTPPTTCTLNTIPFLRHHLFSCNLHCVYSIYHLLAPTQSLEYLSIILLHDFEFLIVVISPQIIILFLCKFILFLLFRLFSILCLSFLLLIIIGCLIVPLSLNSSYNIRRLLKSCHFNLNVQLLF